MSLESNRSGLPYLSVRRSPETVIGEYVGLRKTFPSGPVRVDALTRARPSLKSFARQYRKRTSLELALSIAIAVNRSANSCNGLR